MKLFSILLSAVLAVFRFFFSAITGIREICTIKLNYDGGILQGESLIEKNWGDEFFSGMFQHHENGKLTKRWFLYRLIARLLRYKMFVLEINLEINSGWLELRCLRCWEDDCQHLLATPENARSAFKCDVAHPDGKGSCQLEIFFPPGQSPDINLNNWKGICPSQSPEADQFVTQQA